MSSLNPALSDPVAAGLELTVELCGRCHAYDPQAPWNSIGNSPSFMLMAKYFDRYEERILTVDGRRPHEPLELDLTADDLENIVAYVETLKPAE